MKSITLQIPGGSKYDILIGHDVLPSLGRHVGKLDVGRSVFLITSPRIGKLYLAPVLKSLRSAGFKDIKVELVPDGEKYKSDKSYDKLLTKLVAFDRDGNRKLLVVNLGGGVVGDLGGFLAATYRRGIDYVQVPTTLLAFVDCGIGGKVGINFKGTKNIVGAFHQPRLVYADLSLLNTLCKREMRSGLAEVVKYGVIKSPHLFDLVENNVDSIFKLNRRVIDEVVTTCYGIKADVVERDELDKVGIRAVLNYGHTIGHAVEAASRYAYRHGEAVSIGMACANDIAVKMGYLDKNIAARIENLLIRIGLSVSIKKCQLGDIMSFFWKDKKFENGKNRLVFATKIGATEIVKDVPVEIIEAVIKNRYLERH